MGTAGEEGGLELQLLAKVALVTHRKEPNSKMQNDRFQGSCTHKGAEEPRNGPGEREAQGEVGAQAVSHNLAPCREERGQEKSALNPTCKNRKNHPVNMSVFVGTEGNRHPSAQQPCETICLHKVGEPQTW